MVVHKFGGALCRSRRGLEALCRLVTEADRAEAKRARRTTESEQVHGVVVVTSAIGHTTRHLARAAELASSGALLDAERIIDRIAGQHVALAEQLDLGPAYEREQEALLNDVRQTLEGVAIVRELSGRSRDMILAGGELLAARLITHFLRSRELNVRELDARTVITTDDHHGQAIPVLDETATRARKQVASRLQRGQIILTQGFIGATVDGVTTTMGSESSDLTATLLAGALRAREVVLWKSLSGLFSADPELVPKARRLRTMSFAEAEELGRRGARVLFPSFAEPLTVAGLKTVLRISTPFAPHRSSTTLTRELEGAAGARSVRAQKALAVVTRQRLVLIRMRRTEPEFVSGSDGELVPSAAARRTSARMSRALAGAQVLWRSTRELTVVLPREERASFLRALDRSRYAVERESPVSTVTVVCRKADEAPLDTRFLAGVAHSLRAIPTETILTIERSVMAIVPEEHTLAALAKVHKEMIEG